MTVLQYIGAAVALVGPIGTLLETIGGVIKLPKLEALGQKLENLGADLPEFFTGTKVKAAKVAQP